PQISAVVPASKTSFLLQQAQDYAIIATAIDACGNSFTDEYRFTIKRPEDAPMTGQGASEPKKEFGRLHGVIDTRAGMSGDLVLSPAPKTLRKNEKFISGQDKSFDFGPLPVGTYTLTFDGYANNRKAKLVWEGLEVDTTSGKLNPEKLKLSDAK
ncbi:MAG: hypothetical protein AAGJ83_13725, partial [Planctomycetota bacterium]